MTIVLGKPLYSNHPEENEKFLSSIPRFTYHKDFFPLSNGARTDKNWGCCIRCGQSLLAQYISRLYFGYKEAYMNVFTYTDSGFLELFYDLVNSPFSIHSFCREVINLGGSIGEWVKTSTIARIIKRLLDPFSIPCVIAENGMISRSQMRTSLESGLPVLLLVPLMLGPHKFEFQYLTYLKYALSMPRLTIGGIVGQQARAFFLVGYTKDDILYYDPHITLNHIESKEDEHLLFEPKVNQISPTKMNSSLLLGFIITSLEEVEQLRLSIDDSIICPLDIVDDILAESVPDMEMDKDLDDWDIVQ